MFSCGAELRHRLCSRSARMTDTGGSCLCCGGRVFFDGKGSRADAAKLGEGNQMTEQVWTRVGRRDPVGGGGCAEAKARLRFGCGGGRSRRRRVEPRRRKWHRAATLQIGAWFVYQRFVPGAARRAADARVARPCKSLKSHGDCYLRGELFSFRLLEPRAFAAWGFCVKIYLRFWG